MPILVPSVLLSPSVSHYCTVLYAFEPPAHFGRIGRLCLLQTMYMFRPLPLHLWYLQPHLTFVPRAVLYYRRYSSTVQYILCTIEAAVLYCATALLPPNTTEDLRLRQLPPESEQSSITVQQRLHHSCSTSQTFALPIIHPLYTRLLWPPALHYWLQAAGCPDCHNSCPSLPESTFPALRFIHCHTQRSTADTSARLRGTGACLRSHRSHVGAEGLICDSPAPDQFHTGSARLHRPRTRSF